MKDLPPHNRLIEFCWGGGGGGFLPCLDEIKRIGDLTCATDDFQKSRKM